MMTLAHYLAAITTRVQDTLADDTLTACLSEAVLDYSFDRPCRIVRDLPGTGTVLLSLPDGWEADFSTILCLETVTDGIPAQLQPASYRLAHTPSGDQIQLLTATSPLMTYRVTFSGKHTVSDTGSTVPAADEPLLCDLAASHACRILAAKATKGDNPLMGTVSVNVSSKSDHYLKLASEYAARYRAGLNDRDATSDAALTDDDAPGGCMRAWTPQSSGLFHRAERP